jgi:hypothetical protein
MHDAYPSNGGHRYKKANGGPMYLLETGQLFDGDHGSIALLAIDRHYEWIVTGSKVRNLEVHLGETDKAGRQSRERNFRGLVSDRDRNRFSSARIDMPASGKRDMQL